jgi:ribosomal protein L2
VDWKRVQKGKQLVVRIEYDPNRSAHIALLKHLESKKLSYIVAPDGLEKGQVVESFMHLVYDKQEDKGEEAITRALPTNVGNCLPLKYMPIGSIVHCVGLHKFGKAQLCRSAGTSAQILYTALEGHAQLRLASGEVRKVPVDACATMGTSSNPNHQHRIIGKAGVRRWMGWRPTVRGVAMNAVDHPHGGGRGKSKGNKHPRSPWGVLAKGGKTRFHKNPLVIKARPRKR